jgi:hypothetical protein
MVRNAKEKTFKAKQKDGMTKQIKSQAPTPQANVKP